MAADFQDPVELINDYIKKWEDGARVVVARNKKLIWFFRVN